MISINKTVSYTIRCKCGASITIEKTKEAESKGWQIVKSCYSTDVERELQGAREIFCPECAEKERLRKYNSESIWDRINADYYKDHPEKFDEDAIEYVGLKGHPRASKASSMAYDRGHSGGHSEVLNALQDYAELLIG